MTLKKWAMLGIIVIALACIAVGKAEIGGIAIAGIVGFLKDDKEDTVPEKPQPDRDKEQ